MRQRYDKSKRTAYPKKVKLPQIEFNSIDSIDTADKQTDVSRLTGRVG